MLFVTGRISLGKGILLRNIAGLGLLLEAGFSGL